MQIISHKLEDIDQLKCKELITFICDGCGNNCRKTQKRIIQSIRYRKQNKLYCTVDCFNKYQKKEENWIECFCSECNNKITKSKSEFEKSENHFCSHSCAAFFNNRKRPFRTEDQKQKISKSLKIYYQTHSSPFKGVKKTSKEKEHLNLKRFPRVKRKNERASNSFKCLLNCEFCRKEILRSETEMKKSKNNRFFCSKSCRMKHYNKSDHKIKSFNKSYAEIFLSSIIKNDFPALEIIENNRKILNSGLELDLFIPKYNLAIELNGPVHYVPIYGEERFKTIQNKDIQKQLEIQKLGYNLIIINISKLANKKKTEKFLIKYYLEYIKPIFLVSEMVAAAESNSVTGI